MSIYHVRKKPTLGRWHFWLMLERSPMNLHMFEFTFGIFKLKGQGETWLTTPKSGFMIFKRFSLPRLTFFVQL